MSVEAYPEENVIDVRPDEGFATEALQSWLRGRLEGAEAPLRVRQFGNGHANLTYHLCFGEGSSAVEYVLRRPPLGPVAPGSHDMHREYRALSQLWQAFPYAPRAYVYSEDLELIGSPFLIMERKHGVVVKGEVPERFGAGRDPEANRKLSEVVIDVLVELHAVDPKPIGLEGLGRKPESFLERQVKGWADRYERARTEDLPVADELRSWLLDNLPDSPPPTLLHNDWRLDNMAVCADDPGRCAAVYDWDMCTIGDPLADLGTVIAMWTNPGEAPAGTNPMPTQAPGFMLREQASARYAERSGRDVALLPYYDVFGTFKMAVVLQQIYFRWKQGQTQDARFGGLAQAASALFDVAAGRRP